MLLKQDMAELSRLRKSPQPSDQVDPRFWRYVPGLASEFILPFSDFLESESVDQVPIVLHSRISTSDSKSKAILDRYASKGNVYLKHHGLKPISTVEHCCKGYIDGLWDDEYLNDFYTLLKCFGSRSEMEPEVIALIEDFFSRSTTGYWNSFLTSELPEGPVSDPIGLFNLMRDLWMEKRVRNDPGKSNKQKRDIENWFRFPNTYRPDLIEAFEKARACNGVILSDDRTRLIRGKGNHTWTQLVRNKQTHQKVRNREEQFENPSIAEYKFLQSIANGIKLYTINPPDENKGSRSSRKSSEGIKASTKKAGRPKAKEPGYKKRIREENITWVVEKILRGSSIGSLVRETGIARETIAGWVRSQNC
ncbi:hypothetical protein VN12_08425 [Pirellula sp. SH-Sr6A]|nr:hypothetical protein VN12_08425 [Pirellula sp. SH-Sr6A]